MVVLTILNGAAFVYAGGVPHTVSGTVTYAEGGSPASVSFTATLSSTGDEVTHVTAGCGYNGGYYWVQCASFDGTWSPGDIVTVTIDDGNGRSVTSQVTLTTNANDVLNLVLPANEETVSQPGIPSGETEPEKDQTFTYTTTGAESSLGHTLEYRFNWGDGTASGWSTSKSASHAWSTAGHVTVTVTARCQTHTDKLAFSNPLQIEVIDPAETISTPGTPAGETSPVKDHSYTYTSSGAASSSGHSLEYRYSWGDGTDSAWSTSLSSSHRWSSEGDFSVSVTARCQTHTDKFAVSNSLPVQVEAPVETISKPGKPSGENYPVKDRSYTYSTSGAVSSFGHTIEYQFNWGDGSYSAWTTSNTATHTWTSTGYKAVVVTARCRDHYEKTNQSDPLGIQVLTADDNPPNLMSCYPVPGASAVPRNSSIQLKIVDSNRGIDINSINITIDSMAVVKNGQNNAIGKANITAQNKCFTIYYLPDINFNEGSTVTVNVQCLDHASPANVLDSTYTFQIGHSTVLISEKKVFGEPGGTMTDNVSGIMIEIPGGAMNDSLELSIGIAYYLPALPDSMEGFGIGYHFGPDGLKFLTPVTIHMPYTQQDLIMAGVTNPYDLIPYYYSTSHGKWTALEVIYADNERIAVEVNEFCYFQFIKQTSTGISGQQNNIPMEFLLEQNYPNPFNPETHVIYHLPHQGSVRIEIYNLSGQKIRTLVNSTQSAGSYEYIWDGANEIGMPVSSGTYVIICRAGDQIQSRKATLIK